MEDAVCVGSINTIDTAQVYYTPVAPNTPKNTMIGVAAGLMLDRQKLHILGILK